MFKLHRLLFSCALFFSVAPPALAYDFSGKPVTIVVPYNPGGGTDTIARRLSNQLSRQINTSVIVENKAGADGIIGTSSVVRSKPDGHTYALVVNTHVVNPLFHKTMPYDTFKDLTGVTMIAKSPLVLIVPASLGVKTLDAFLELAKKNPEKFAYGSSENFTKLVGARFVKEQGMPDFSMYVTYSLFAPAGTPEEIVQAMQQEIRKAVMTREVRDALQAQVAEPVANPVAEFNRQLLNEYSDLSKLASSIGLKAGRSD